MSGHVGVADTRVGEALVDQTELLFDGMQVHVPLPQSVGRQATRQTVI